MPAWDIMDLPYEKRRAIVDARRKMYENKRVKFVRHGHPEPDPLVSGEEGECVLVDDIGTLLVKWDSGRSLGVLVGDEVEILC